MSMGVGTNVQRRAVALHHMTCPWRPADLDQREGRIVRQGNSYSEVEIYRYVVEGSLDAYGWQTVERKARFINAFMHGRMDTREMEEIDEDVLSLAQTKAIASGNKLLMEVTQVEDDLRKKTRLRMAHNYRRKDILSKQRYCRDECLRTESRIATYDTILTAYNDIIDDPLSSSFIFTKSYSLPSIPDAETQDQLLAEMFDNVGDAMLAFQESRYYQQPRWVGYLFSRSTLEAGNWSNSYASRLTLTLMQSDNNRYHLELGINDSAIVGKITLRSEWAKQYMKRLSGSLGDSDDLDVDLDMSTPNLLPPDPEDDGTPNTISGSLLVQEAQVTDDNAEDTDTDEWKEMKASRFGNHPFFDVYPRLVQQLRALETKKLQTAKTLATYQESLESANKSLETFPDDLELDKEIRALQQRLYSLKDELANASEKVVEGEVVSETTFAPDDPSGVGGEVVGSPGDGGYRV